MNEIKTPHGFNHAEAFCHMQYYGRKGFCQISLTIWNSRDGVTPFVTISKEYGIELQHVNFQLDRLDVDYKPKKGDLIWRDTKLEEARQYAGDTFDRWSKTVEDEKLNPKSKIKKEGGYDRIAHLTEIISPGREEVIESLLNNHQPGEPHLELVKEDWI